MLHRYYFAVCRGFPRERSPEARTTCVRGDGHSHLLPDVVWDGAVLYRGQTGTSGCLAGMGGPAEWQGIVRIPRVCYPPRIRDTPDSPQLAANIERTG